jgi:hypothetical protein
MNQFEDVKAVEVSPTKPKFNYRAFVLPMLFLAIALFFLIRGALGVIKSYEEGTLIPVVPEIIYKHCAVKFPSGETLSGTREFIYQYRSIFGFKLIDEATVLEKTHVNIEGEPMTIVGLNPVDWYAIPIGPGERYRQLLKKADVLTFVMRDRKETAVINYDEFCK